MSPILWSAVVCYALVAQASCSPQWKKVDNAWGIKTCVIQDELQEDDYGCDVQEIKTTDFKGEVDRSCTPEVHSVHVKKIDIGLVTITFAMDTPSCHRNHNRARGVVVQLAMSRLRDVDYKILSIKTKNRLQTNGEVISYNITVALPNQRAMFTARVYPIQPKKYPNSFEHPMVVGKYDEHHTNIEKRYQPDDEYVCKCEDIIVTTNNTISVTRCDSPHWNSSSTVTLQGADTISTPTNKSECEENYSNLVDGVYTVLTYYECKNGKTLECPKDITIQTQKGNVKVTQTDDTFDMYNIMMIVGLSTMAFVVVLTYGILIQHHHKAANKLKGRNWRLKERNDIMLVYFSASGLKEKIGEFAGILGKASRLPVHFADDEASQGQRFSNKFDWLDECVRNSSNFVFIASRDIYELLEKKCKGNANNALHSMGDLEVDIGNEQAWMAGVFCYVMDLLRGKRFYGLKRSRCFIVSFKDDEKGGKHDYAHKMSQLSIFQSKGTKICYVSQRKPVTIPRKFLQELHGYKRLRQINEKDADTEEQEILLPMEGSDLLPMEGSDLLPMEGSDLLPMEGSDETTAVAV